MKIPEWTEKQRDAIQEQIDHYEEMRASDKPKIYKVSNATCVFCIKFEECYDCPNRIMDECDAVVPGYMDIASTSTESIMQIRNKYCCSPTPENLKTARKQICTRIRQLRNWLKKGGQNGEK